MKKHTKNLKLTTHTIRNLQADQLAYVAAGSISVQSGTSIINPSGGVTSLLANTSLNPSGGRH